MEPEVRLDGQGIADIVIDLSRPDPIIELREPRLELVVRPAGLCGASMWQRAVKRAVDIVGSALGLLVLSPLLLVTALAVKVTSVGPAVYVSERVGRGGRPLRMVKFRSMYHGAHHTRDHHGHLNIHDSGPIFKIREDPRVTPVGRFLRRCSIDELPQLWNVLRGDMSLVGPRPPLPEEFLHYGRREARRLDVKPGITCIWQVSGRSDLDFETWVDMDLVYIETWSLRLDARLLARTLAAVVSGRGAY
jgi:lipopolysaccharide/colanic/teichoic acid biosynthesis glycosyltransferase